MGHKDSGMPARSLGGRSRDPHGFEGQGMPGGNEGETVRRLWQPRL